MFFIGQKRASVAARFAQFMAIVALHVDGTSTEITLLSHFAHSAGAVTELIVVASGDFQLFAFRIFDEIDCLHRVERKWLLNIDVTAVVEAEFCKTVMALRRGRDMDYIRPRFGQHGFDIAKGAIDLKAFAELPGHQFFAVADGNDLAPGYALNLRCVRIGDLAATDYGNPKHVPISFYNSRSNAEKRQSRKHLASNRGGSLLS